MSLPRANGSTRLRGSRLNGAHHYIVFRAEQNVPDDQKRGAWDPFVLQAVGLAYGVRTVFLQ